MPRVTDVEPMIDMCRHSEGYGKPFGVILWYGNTRRRYTNLGQALCANLTAKQRKYVQDLRGQLEGNNE